MFPSFPSSFPWFPCGEYISTEVNEENGLSRGGRCRKSPLYLNPVQEGGKPGIGFEPVEGRIQVQPGEPFLPFGPGLFQPFKGFILEIQAGADESREEGA